LSRYVYRHEAYIGAVGNFWKVEKPLISQGIQDSVIIDNVKKDTSTDPFKKYGGHEIKANEYRISIKSKK
jgi:hypothetical protein